MTKKLILAKKLLSFAAITLCPYAFATTTFSFSGSEQQFTAPETGMYLITAFGAAGGGSTIGTRESGGKGAEIGGDFDLTAGEVLDIYVGGVGGSANFGGGGGGGSFVVEGTTPLVVGGGGGGASAEAPGGAGQTSASNSNGGAGGAGGGGGGGGFTGSGSNGFPPGDSGSGGSGFPTLTGGAGDSDEHDGPGGFGGGGGGGAFGGGGGGGFSGGAGGGDDNVGGGGGGSFDSGSNQILIAGENSGDGSVDITLLTPEPASFTLVGISLAALFVWRRRRIPHAE
jgi:PEP-CTERM motif